MTPVTPIEGHARVHPVSMAQEPDKRIPNPDGRLHSKIIEILSSTSNGCLTELGYHPGMTEKLYQYMQHIQTLEGENAKLYQDNCQLSNSIQLLNDRVTHLSANQNTQLQQFAAMQEKIRTLETERNNLVRNNQDILISTSAGTSHHLLAVELTRMRAQTSRVLRDMSILQTKYARLNAAQYGQISPGGVSSPSDPVSQIALPVIPTPSDAHQRRSSADGAPRLQPSRLPLQQPQPQPHLRPMQQQVQHTHLQPQQQQHGQQVQAQRRSSFNPYPQQRSLPEGVRWTIPLPASAPPMFGVSSPTTDSTPSPFSAPPNPTRPHLLLPMPPHTHVSQTAYRTASAPVLPLNKSHTTPLRLPPSLIDMTREEPNEMTAEQPARDGYIDNLSGLKRPSSAVGGAPALDNEVIKRQRTAEPIQTPQDVMVNEKPLSPEAKPASDATSPGQVGLSNDEVAIAATPSVGSNPTSPLSAEPSPSAPLEKEMMTGPQSGNDTRSVEDCVYMIYEPDAETSNGYFCGRCFDRFESGMLPEPPDVLTSPKFEDLLMHCVKEHPAIWSDLRCKRDLEAPPS